MKQFPAGKSLRLRRRRDIDRVFSDGVRAADGVLTLIAARRLSPDAPSRVGTGVSKRHGNAVARNRVKRLCREAFRLSRDELPTGWDFMVIPRAGAKLSLASISRSLVKLAGRLSRRADGQGRA